MDLQRGRHRRRAGHLGAGSGHIENERPAVTMRGDPLAFQTG